MDSLVQVVGLGQWSVDDLRRTLEGAGGQSREGRIENDSTVQYDGLELGISS
jgi:hypothetical protein